MKYKATMVISAVVVILAAIWLTIEMDSAQVASRPDRIESSTPIPNPAQEAIVLDQIARDEEIAKLNRIVKAADHDHDGGSYIDDGGKVVIQLTAHNPELEQQLLAASRNPDEISIEYVKYSAAELQNAQNQLNAQVHTGSVAAIMNVRLNKVSIYISGSQLGANKDQILKVVPEDMIDWQVGEIAIVDQSF